MGDDAALEQPALRALAYSCRASLANLLPEGLVPDTFDGSAWIGVVPFSMDNIRLRTLPRIPGANSFPELNLRTYVRETHTNQVGVYFFSLDASSLLAVTVARTIFQLPYYWARMHVKTTDEREYLLSQRAHLRTQACELSRTLSQPEEKP